MVLPCKQIASGKVFQTNFASASSLLVSVLGIIDAQAFLHIFFHHLIP